MKKSKKLVSLLLALAFAFSLMATTALAAGDVQPRYPVGMCPQCLEPARYFGRGADNYLYIEYGIGQCKLRPAEKHNHMVRFYLVKFDCPHCGIVYDKVIFPEQCLLAGTRYDPD